MTDELDLTLFHDWLIFGERGESSDSIVQVVTGRKDFRHHGGHVSYPSDHDDLRRCLLLLEAVPAARGSLPLVAATCPQWAAIIEHLDELTALYDVDFPEWRGSAHRRHPKVWPGGLWEAPCNVTLRNLLKDASAP